MASVSVLPRDVFVFRGRPEQLLEHSDADALQAACAQAVAIAAWNVPIAARGDVIGRIGADGRIEHERQIDDRAREWTADVLRMRERHDAGTA